MIQAGQYPFPPQTGAHLVQPGPTTHEGLMYGPQDPTLETTTLAAINAMLGDMSTTDRSKGMDGFNGELARTWSDDMV